MKKSIKEQYAGLDVSLKSVSMCVSDGAGKVLWRGEVANEPSDVARVLRRRAPGLVRAVLETGSCGIYLYRGLKALSVPVVCVCARHAKGVLRCLIPGTYYITPNVHAPELLQHTLNCQTSPLNSGLRP